MPAAAILSAALICPLAAVAGALIVEARNTPSVTSSILESGLLHRIEARGTFRYDSQGSAADAEWVHDAFGAYGPGVDGWVENTEAPGYADELDLCVDGQAQNWLGTADEVVTEDSIWHPHTFSPSHIYRLDWMGADQPLTFRIEDGPPGGARNSGNVGHFYVEISPAASPGDCNLDGVVDDDDLSLLLINYWRTGVGWPEGDFTGDGTVADNDLSLLLANWTGPVGAEVPEPATLALLAAGTAVALVRKREWRAKGRD